jgi:RNA polymerase subunit RPABC4/transcription elongation factor Spt4
MDFLEDLFDFGGRRGRGRHGRGQDHGQDDERGGFDRRDHDDHDCHDQAVACAKCSKQVPVSSKYCDECGSPVKANFKCASCGSRLQSEAKFCPSCGVKTVA